MRSAWYGLWIVDLRCELRTLAKRNEIIKSTTVITYT